MKINTEKIELMFQKYHQFDNDKVKITLKNDVAYIGFLLEIGRASCRERV